MANTAVLDKTGKAERGAQLQRDGIIIRTWDLMKTYVMGDQTIHAVSGRGHRDPEGRIRRHHGPFGLGEIDADESDRVPGYAERGFVLPEREAGQRHGRR